MNRIRWVTVHITISHGLSSALLYELVAARDPGVLLRFERLLVDECGRYSRPQLHIDDARGLNPVGLSITSGYRQHPNLTVSGPTQT